MYRVQELTSFFACGYSGTICWKDSCFCLCMHPCQILVDHTFKGLFWNINPIPLINMSVFMVMLYCLGYHSFLVSFITEKHESSNFCSFSKLFWLVLWISKLIWAYQLINVCKKKQLAFFWICRSTGKYYHFSSINSSIR